jgi:hypothetical protein
MSYVEEIWFRWVGIFNFKFFIWIWVSEGFLRGVRFDMRHCF